MLINYLFDFLWHGEGMFPSPLSYTSHQIERDNMRVNLDEFLCIVFENFKFFGISSEINIKFLVNLKKKWKIDNFLIKIWQNC